jgi:hypothetical protein
MVRVRSCCRMALQWRLTPPAGLLSRMALWLGRTVPGCCPAERHALWLRRGAGLRLPVEAPGQGVMLRMPGCLTASEWKRRKVLSSSFTPLPLGSLLRAPWALTQLTGS